MKHFDIVYLLKDIPKEQVWCDEQVPKDGFKKGSTGTIVEVYTKPSLGFEVEFLDEEGNMIGIATLEPADIEISNPQN